MRPNHPLQRTRPKRRAADRNYRGSRSMRILAIVLSILVSAYQQNAIADTNYSKTIELPPLRVSYADLQATLDKISSLMTTANTASSNWREELELRSGNLSVRISGHQLEPLGAKIPLAIDSFEYTVSARGDAPITRIAIRFADYRRSISVEGQSPEQVDAVFYAVREDMSKVSTLMGGYWLHTILRFIAIFVLGVTGMQLAVLWWQTRRRSLAMAVAIAGLSLTTLLVLPLTDMLAGFSAVRGDPSLLVRYGPEISFWGLIVGFLSLIPLFSKGTPPATESHVGAGVPASNTALKETRRRRRDS